MKQQTMGKQIAELRKDKGMTQLELAQQMHVTDKAVSKWECDKAAPDVHSLPKLAALLGTTTDALLAAVATPVAATPKTSEVWYIIRLILRAVALAMGVATVVLSLLKEIDLPDAVTMLGIGMVCLAVYTLEQKED
ncbi:MAG: helix-turn-helix domain-containing protein [Oscillospiraceae bacterium]|jgi:transcriptional regulator with XRE-family HTH domain|nr:helix-turn-helix domain-containing protein [Oscillospiraceae bacterium]